MIELEKVTLDFPVPKKVKKLENKNKNADQATGGMMGTQANGKYALRALDNVSFSLQPGDKLGLIGHNGAGKTTLLRVMAGLYVPTSGRVTAQGKVTALLNLSFGMDGEATGYENILLRGLYLGMSRAEIKSKTESIAEFSELSDFLHLPVRTYSAGMRARLAFAVSMHIDASTILLDEAIGAGDAAFFQKARQKLDSMVNEATLVFASHSNQTIREICNKGLLLEHGKIKAFGDLDEVLRVYEKRTNTNHAVIADVSSKKGAFAGLPNKSQIKKVLLVNDTGALPNPGCKAVRKAYKLLFERHIHKAEISKSIPVNYWM
ncbi:MAG: ABC transporter ATP-binding protein, partial [Planctomycetaceae bacterium]|nr:ABC transporter ATP-binding protein [Planctomycetaceae bacterium]